MTIDEAIEQQKEKAKLHRESIIQKDRYYNMPHVDSANKSHTFYAEEHEQLAEWLEELKALRNGLNIKCDSLNEALEKGKKIGYNKAIDDFAKLVETWCWKHEQYNQDDLNKLMNIAEQLKAGGENERSI